MNNAWGVMWYLPFSMGLATKFPISITCKSHLDYPQAPDISTATPNVRPSNVFTFSLKFDLSAVLIVSVINCQKYTNPFRLEFWFLPPLLRWQTTLLQRPLSPDELNCRPPDLVTLGSGCISIVSNFFKTSWRIFSIDNSAAYLVLSKTINTIQVTF